MANKVEKKVVKDFQENISYLSERLGVKKSFDVIRLDLEYAGRQMALFMVDGFVKDDILHFLMKYLSRLEPEQIEGDTLGKLLKTHIPYVEIEKTDNLDSVVHTVLAGPTALVVDGIDEVILIDARTYPVRGPQEPDMERVVRGSRDGYVETIVFNTALTRRRIRDRSLRMEYLQIGRRSKTDVVVCYLEDIADLDHVDELKKSLKAIDTDGLPMGDI
jgi:stage V sporulation protein AF